MPIRRGTQGLKLYRPASPAAAVSVDAATTAWVNAVIADGGTVSGTQQGYVDTLIKSLKSASVWSKMDRIWLLASENTHQARIDLKALANTFTDVGTLSFTANVGYTCSSGNGIDTGYNPTTVAGNFTANAASFGAYLKSGAGANEGVMGVNNNSAFCYLEPDGTAANYEINGSSFPSPADTNTSGRYTVTRTGASATAIYRNGASLSTGTGASSGTIPNATFSLFYINGFGHPATMTLGAAWMGGGLNSTEVASFDSAMAAYQTSIGN